MQSVKDFFSGLKGEGDKEQEFNRFSKHRIELPIS
jgi:hypothetical protein